MEGIEWREAVANSPAGEAAEVQPTAGPPDAAG
jgi:hypothetical protein